MKTQFIALVLSSVLAAGINSLSAQNTSQDMKGHSMDMSRNTQSAKPAAGTVDTVKVSGNCDQCKKRIETAAMSVKGVKSAKWDMKTKVLRLTWNGPTNTVDVQKAVAKAGYDSGPYKATKEAYDALPGCCRYRN